MNKQLYNIFFIISIISLTLCLATSVNAESDYNINNSSLAIYEAAEKANRQGDRKTAFEKFYIAAQQKQELAYGKLASMYLYGLGTKKDAQQAYIWFHIAYLSGDRSAERFRDAASSLMTRDEYYMALDAAEKRGTELGLAEDKSPGVPR